MSPRNNFYIIDDNSREPASEIEIEMATLSDEALIDAFEFRRQPVSRFYEYLGTTGAEWNYAVGVPLNYVMTYSQTIPPHAGLGITLGWNYLDAVYAIGLGTLQLLDEEDYRQTQNKAKGLLNIISGVQLFLLSYNPYLTAALGLTGGAALAAPSFALAMACDLVTASIDFYNAQKEVKFEGWVEERAKEIAYNEKRILKIEDQIKTLDRNNKNEALEIKYLETKKESLNHKIDDIQNNIYARSRVYCRDSDNNLLADRLQTVKTVLNKYHPIQGKKLKARNAQLGMKATEEDCNKDKAIQEQLTENYKQNRINLFIKTASFVGMTLLAVSAFVSCPPLLIVGLAVTTGAAAYYIHKNSDNIIKAINNFGLFSKKEEKITNEANNGYAFLI